MKLEIGGSGHDGSLSRGDGWVNIDWHESADIRHDLNQQPWPIEDDVVTEVYSSHCIEHLNGPHITFNELCRICKVGASIELRMPAPGGDLMMVYDHKHCFSPIAAINMERYHAERYWNQPRRMKYIYHEFQCSEFLHEAKEKLPFLTGIDDQTIMRFIPATAHDIRYFYTIVENEFYKPPDGNR